MNVYDNIKQDILNFINTTISKYNVDEYYVVEIVEEILDIMKHDNF